MDFFCYKSIVAEEKNIRTKLTLHL